MCAKMSFCELAEFGPTSGHYDLFSVVEAFNFIEELV